MVSDVPFTVTVAVLMRLPELLLVGVIPPPLPYLPPPYTLLLLVVGVVPPAEEVVPDSLVLLPQAAKRTTSVANTNILDKVRILACKVKKLLSITFSSFISGDTCTENESSNDIYI